MRLGIDSFSLRSQGWDAFQILDYAAGLNLDNVHFSERAHLGGLNPDALARVRTYAVTARVLARQALDATMRGLSIGSVSRAATSGATDTIVIALQPDGRLAITLREPGDDAQTWIPVGEP